MLSNPPEREEEGIVVRHHGTIRLATAMGLFRWPRHRLVWVPANDRASSMEVDHLPSDSGSHGHNQSHDWDRWSAHVRVVLKALTLFPHIIPIIHSDGACCY